MRHLVLTTLMLLAACGARTEAPSWGPVVREVAAFEPRICCDEPTCPTAYAEFATWRRTTRTRMHGVSVMRSDADEIMSRVDAIQRCHERQRMAAVPAPVAPSDRTLDALHDAENQLESFRASHPLGSAAGSGDEATYRTLTTRVNALELELRREVPLTPPPPPLDVMQVVKRCPNAPLDCWSDIEIVDGPPR